MAVEAGIRKINVGTALNVAYTSAIRNALSAHPSAADPRGYLGAARQAIGDTVADLCSVVAAPSSHRVDAGGAR
jgi:fructose-bisphosphate aldolase class II